MYPTHAHLYAHTYSVYTHETYAYIPVYLCFCDFTKHFRSPFGISSRMIINWWENHAVSKNQFLVEVWLLLTGSPTVTTPCNLMTLAWKNCPIMAASLRKLTLSFSGTLGRRVLTATSSFRPQCCHTPLCTVPKCPLPMQLLMLWVHPEKNKGHTVQ